MAEKAAQQNTKPLVRAYANNLRIAPRKMRLVTNLVKNMRVEDAMTQLQFTNKKGAKMLKKLLQSAVANAEHNFSLNREGLYIKSLTCDMGPMLKRSFPRARGSAFMIRRKLSHVNVVLEERPLKGKKKAVIPAPAKKAAKPVATEEGSKGIPKEVEVAKLTEETAPKEVHHGNDSDTVKSKKSAENIQK